MTEIADLLECGSCRFFAAGPIEGFDGECRFNPPMQTYEITELSSFDIDDDDDHVMIGQEVRMTPRWPQVRLGEWCGQYESTGQTDSRLRHPSAQ